MIKVDYIDLNTNNRQVFNYNDKYKQIPKRYRNFFLFHKLNKISKEIENTYILSNEKRMIICIKQTKEITK